MKNLNFLATLTFLAIVSSCGSSYDYDEDYMDDYISTVAVNVDNAADTNVIVTLKGIDMDTLFELDIPSYSLELVYLPYGKYTVNAITTLDSVILQDEEIFIDEENYHYSYNLNLTKEDYIVENIRYSVGVDLSSKNDKFTYNGETYEGISADVITGKLLVPNNWDYNIDEEAPDEVEVSSSQNFAIKKKLYRANTFIVYLMLYDLFGEYDDEEGETTEW